MSRISNRPVRAWSLGLVCAFLLIFVLVSVGGASAALINRKLSGTLVTNGDVLEDGWALSPDGQTVIFAANKLTYDKIELFSVPIKGGLPIVISGVLAPGDNVGDTAIANNEWAVFGVKPPGSANMTRLYAAPLDGASPPVSLIPGSLSDYAYIKSFRVSPNGQYVAYVLDDSISTAVFDTILFVSDLAGNWRQVSPCDNPSDTECSVGDDYTFTPNSTRIVYTGCLGHCTLGPSLYSAGLPSGELYNLFSPVLDFVLTPDSLYAIGLASYEFYKIPLNDEAPDPLTSTSAAPPQFAVNADSTRLVYTDVADYHQILKSISLSGGSPVTLSGSFIEAGDVTDFKITPNGQSVIFRGDLDTDDKYELYGAGIATPGRVKLSGAVMAGDVQDDYQITPDSLSVVYRANQDYLNQIELFARVSGSGTPVKISDTVVTNGNVTHFAIFPNGLSVAYLADQEAYQRFELFGWTAFGGGMHFPINSPLVTYGDVDEVFSVLPDSSGVVYLADQQFDEKYELWLTRDLYPIYLPLVIR